MTDEITGQTAPGGTQDEQDLKLLELIAQAEE
jgi:hypothetical protein